MSYKLVKKTIAIADAAKPFNIYEGRVVSVANTIFNDDFSISLWLLVEVFSA